MLSYVAGVNVAIGIFNLIPGFPLDGGRLVRALLWSRSRRLEWATRWSCRLGRIIGCAFMVLGLCLALVGALLDGLWLALIGWFLEGAARSSYRRLADNPVVLHIDPDSKDASLAP